MGIIIDRNTGGSYTGDVFSLIILEGVLCGIMQKRVLKPTSYTEVKCDWCDKSISSGSACCPYCGHAGPAFEWKNNPKKISFKITPHVLNGFATFYVQLIAKWVGSDGMDLSAYYCTEFYERDSTKDYLLEIEVPQNAHVSVSLKMVIPRGGDDPDETCYFPPMDEKKTVISEPGMYEIVLCKKPKKGWLITKYIDAFKINRIG